MNIFRRLKEKKTENVLKLVEARHKFRRILILLIGQFVYASAYNLFFLKNNIVFGGVAGISIITKEFIEPTLCIFLASIILLLFSLIFLGKKATLNSLLGTILFPIFVKLTENIGNYISISNDNLLLIALVGGVCVGFGSGLVFKAGYTNGGTDILNQIFSKYFKTSLGTSMIMTDGVILLIGGFKFGWTKMLYGMIVLYIITIMVDKVVLGISSSKAIYVNTSKEDGVSDYLINELNKGVTIIESRGGYTHNRSHMIMTVIATSDYFRVKEGILQIDPNAVIIATDAYQSHGTYEERRGVE